MNRYIILFILYILLTTQTAFADDNKEYICVDKKVVKSPPPTLGISSGATSVENNKPLCQDGKVPKSNNELKDVKIENKKMIGRQSVSNNKSSSSTSEASNSEIYCGDGYCYHWAKSYENVDNYGVFAYLTQHNPEILDNGFHSEAMITVADGALNQVAIGWRKGKHDTSPKLFVYWWKSGEPQCYNNCQGWVQYSSYYYPGMTVTPGQYIPYTIYYYNGDWWMTYNGQWIGYYDGGYFKTAFNLANYAMFMGEVKVNSGLCAFCYNTDMGNGLWASNPYAAQIYKQKYRVPSNTLVWWINSNTIKYATTPNLYTVQSTGPNSMRYGGPGAGGNSVKPAITVEYPNGGESLARSSVNTIKWRYDGQPGPNIRIDLYKGGVFNKVITYSTPIYSSTGGIGSYNWNTPYTQVLGSDYKIKITSTSNSAYNDWSNNYFTVKGTSYIKVTSPNGGESWQRGTTKTITWTKSGDTGSYVRILLYKSGVYYLQIASSTPNDGSHSWNIPWSISPGSDYKIRVITFTANSLNDWSDNNFRIY